MTKKMMLGIFGLVLVLNTPILSGCSLTTLIGGSQDENIYYGTAEADQVDLSAEVGGRLKEIKYQEGQRVAAGTVVARIDTPENLIKAEQSATSVKNAENELAKLNEGTRQEEIKAQAAMVQQAAVAVRQAENAALQGTANLKAAQTAYDYKKKILADIQALYNSSAVSKQELDAAKNAFDNAGYALTNAQLAKTTAGQQVSSAKAQLAAAQNRLALLKNGATETNKTTAQYGIAQAEQNYSLSKLLLDKANLVTLSAGVIESVNYSVGEYVTPGSAVVTLVDPQDQWVRIFVPEKALPLIKLDQKVTMSSDFLKGKTINGRITYIANQAEFTPMNIVTKNDRMKQVYAVKIKILDHLQEVKPGMLLDVDLGGN